MLEPLNLRQAEAEHCILGKDELYRGRAAEAEGEVGEGGEHSGAMGSCFSSF